MWYTFMQNNFDWMLTFIACHSTITYITVNINGSFKSHLVNELHYNIINIDFFSYCIIFTNSNLNLDLYWLVYKVYAIIMVSIYFTHIVCKSIINTYNYVNFSNICSAEYNRYYLLLYIQIHVHTNYSLIHVLHSYILEWEW